MPRPPFIFFFRKLLRRQLIPAASIQSQPLPHPHPPLHNCPTLEATRWEFQLKYSAANRVVDTFRYGRGMRPQRAGMRINFVETGNSDEAIGIKPGPV